MYWVGLILLTIACVILSKKIFKAISSKNWEEIDAEILNIRQHKSVGVNENNNSYYVKIKYKYNLNGVEYVNDTIVIGYSFNIYDPFRYKCLQEKISVKPFCVFFNTKEPHQSTIYKGISRELMIILIGYIVFTINYIIF